jgi:hypothetical protein
MTDNPDCERRRRIKSAIEQGHSRDAAREAHGWDERSQDDCPMLPRPYSRKPHANDASARLAYIEANTLIVRGQLQKARVGLAHLLDAASGK